jgi:hypothetical protein
MNVATPNTPTPIKSVSTKRPPAMANRPLGPALSFVRSRAQEQRGPLQVILYKRYECHLITPERAAQSGACNGSFGRPS